MGGLALVLAHQAPHQRIVSEEVGWQTDAVVPRKGGCLLGPHLCVHWVVPIAELTMFDGLKRTNYQGFGLLPRSLYQLA